MRSLLPAATLLAIVGALACACGPRVEYRARPGYASSEELPDEVVLEDGTIIRYVSIGEFLARQRALKRGEKYVEGGAQKVGEPAAPSFLPWQELEDGSVRIEARSPEHVVANAMRGFREERYGDLWEQLVSKGVRSRAESEGGADAARERFAAWGARNRTDAMTLLNRMSFAFSTNGVVMRGKGGGLFELSLAPQISQDFKLRVVEVVIETSPEGQRAFLAGIR
ncbi:MAG: hypothetical protein GC172_10715 [Phycisphaera sp.]|nr:hypothetical protein [Phycisphaera sp.]